MTTPPRDRHYLETIRQLPCCLRGHGECGGDVEAHHAFKARAGGGLGLKGSDYSAVPLCHLHHQAVHSRSVPLLWGVVLASAVVALAGQEALRLIPDEREVIAPSKRREIVKMLGDAVEVVVGYVDRAIGGAS